MREVLKALMYTLPFFVFGQTPPSIVIEGEQNYCAENPMAIVTNAEITNTNGTNAVLQAVYIQISLGYAFGQDMLSLTGSHPNISAFWSSALGELTLNGPATYSEFITAIEAVRFQTTQSNFSEDKFFSVNLGNANYLPSTQHYYFYVPSLGITWSQARDEAARLFSDDHYRRRSPTSRRTKLWYRVDRRNRCRNRGYMEMGYWTRRRR